MFEEKVAIITGAAGALGSVTTRAFLENKAKVVAMYHTEGKYKDLLTNLGELGNNIHGVHGDATSKDDCQRLLKETIDRHGKVDILVNLVGGWRGGKTLDKTSAETWDVMVDLNAKTVFLCCKEAIPYMKEAKYGKIVNISSKSSTKEGRMKNSSAYAAAKSAVRTLTQAMAEEFRDKNININCIIPSTIDTEDNRKMLPNADYSKWVPPELIADTIMFLCSDKSKEINGACIPVYGRS